MADYAEGPFERVEGVQWSTEATDFISLITEFHDVFDVVSYIDCSDVADVVENTWGTSWGAVQIVARSPPPVYPGGNGTMIAASLPSGDSLTLSWSGYSCTPASTMRATPEATGAAVGTLSGVTQDATIFMVGAQFIPGVVLAYKVWFHPFRSGYSLRLYKGSF